MQVITQDIYDKKCATRQLIEMMSEKWVPGLIYALSTGPQRPGVLAKRLEGISKKMLTQSLRNLEDWGVVERIVYDVVPPHVEYRLTTDGERFIEPLSLLHGWALENRDEIADVFQRRRDAKTATT